MTMWLFSDDGEGDQGRCVVFNPKCGVSTAMVQATFANTLNKGLIGGEKREKRPGAGE